MTVIRVRCARSSANVLFIPPKHPLSILLTPLLFSLNRFLCLSPDPFLAIHSGGRTFALVINGRRVMGYGGWRRALIASGRFAVVDWFLVRKRPQEQLV